MTSRPSSFQHRSEPRVTDALLRVKHATEQCLRTCDKASSAIAGSLSAPWELADMLDKVAKAVDGLRERAADPALVNQAVYPVALPPYRGHVPFLLQTRKTKEMEEADRDAKRRGKRMEAGEEDYNHACAHVASTAAEGHVWLQGAMAQAERQLLREAEATLTAMAAASTAAAATMADVPPSAGGAASVAAGATRQ